MKLKELEYRTIALQQLKSHVFHLLDNSSSRNKIVFKAPTGSGKTVTIALLMKNLAEELPLKLEVGAKNVAYLWIAPNYLHIQSYYSLKSFFSDNNIIKALQFEDVTDDCLNPNDLLFLNWQSISSEDNLFVRDNETNKDLYTYLENTRQNGTEIVLIIDEAHLFGAKGEKAQKVLEKINAQIEIDVSATPKTRSDFEVIIHRKDVVKEQMIKKGVSLNPNLKSAANIGQDANLFILQEALAKRRQLKEKYRSAGAGINPLLLIQLPSDSQKISKSDAEIKKLVTSFLQTQDITFENHKLAIWLSNEKLNLEEISENNNQVEVLLFKQAIAMGWDCPRASVLLIFREMNQEAFTVQTLGRILRMPEQIHYPIDELNYGYVYTNLEKNLIQLVAEEMEYISFNKSIRKDSYIELKLKTDSAESSFQRNRLGLHFKTALFMEAEAMFGITMGLSDARSIFSANIEKMKNKSIDMQTTAIEIALPTDVLIDVTQEGSTSVTQTMKFAKTNYQLEHLFSRFCLNNCGDYQKDGSWERIRYHIKLLFLEYFGMGDNETYKVVLHHQQIFTDLLNAAREKYTLIMNAKAKTKNFSIKTRTWEIPEFRLFSNTFVAYTVEKSIHQPFYLRQNKGFLGDSKNEIEFIDFLESNSAQIEWWDKNGTGNNTDFAIHYINSRNETSLFYPDILVLFKNGMLGLFDPKTIDSDKDLVPKHNALIEYISTRNKLNQPTTGGIVIKKDGSWRFSQTKIEPGYDPASWKIFNPLF
jgi:type III restriction enzyme